MPYQNGAFYLPTTSDELVTLATDLKSAFSFRDLRMQTDQDWLEGRRGIDEDGLKVTLRTPAILHRKAAAMIASAKLRKQITARRQEDDQIAQEAEDLLTWHRQERGRRYRRGLRNPLAIDEALYVLGRGWLVGRLMLNPDDPRFPWSYSLLDPLHVYPCLAGDQVPYVAHMCKYTVAQIMAEWPEAAATFDGKRPEDTVQYVALYTDQETAVVVDNAIVKEPTPHEYGFNPLVITTATGMPWRGTEKHLQDWTAHMGTGILETVREPVDLMQKLVLMYYVRLAKEADPPLIYKSQDDALLDIDSRARGQTVIGIDEDIAPLKMGPQAADVAPLAQIIQQEVERGSLGAGAFADSAKFASGFHEAVAAAGSSNQIFPYATALEEFYDEIDRRILELYAHFMPQADPAYQIQYAATDPNTGQKAWNTLDPGRILEADILVENQFKDIIPQNEFQKAQIGYQAAQAHILDLDHIRERYYDDDRPQSTNERVLADLILQQPQLVQALSMAAGLRTGNPYLVPVLLQMMQGAGQGQGPAEETGEGGPPPANAQGPNTVQPDEMGMNVGAGPGDSNLGGPTSSNTVNQATLPGVM